MQPNKDLDALGIRLSDLLHEGTDEAWAVSWTKFIDGFEGDVRRFLLSKGVSDVTVVEELIGEVWASAWLYLQSFEPTRPLRPWLLAMADNARRDYQRQSARHDEKMVDVKSVDPLAKGHDADGPLLAADTQARLQQALRPRDLELLDLSWRGYAAAEIAAVLGVTPSSVHEMLSRARRLAREVLREP